MASVSSGCRVLKSNKSAEISGFFSKYPKPNALLPQRDDSHFISLFQQGCFPKGRYNNLWYSLIDAPVQLFVLKEHHWIRIID
jgi:hypothetical protein